MAIKSRGKTGAKATKTVAPKTDVKETVSPAMTKMTTVSFRTRQLLKKKAEAVFEDMGISTSAAINMFLAQVVRDKGMPFTPNAQRKNSQASDAKANDNAGFIALEELWDEL